MYYETIFIVNPDVSQENTQAMTDKLVERVEKAGGRIVKREYWGSRPLAYQIAKRKRGHYTLLVTDGEPAAAKALEEALRLDETVMRFLTTRLTEISDEPSPLLRKRTAPEEEVAETPAEAPAKTAADEPPAEEAPAEEEAVAEAPAEEEAAKPARSRAKKVASEEADGEKADA